MERHPPIAAAIAVAGTVASWLSVWNVYRAGDSFGIDFGVFHGAGTLIRTEGYDAAYDPERFAPFFVEQYYPSLAGQRSVSHFISPPTFGWLVQPLSTVPFWASLWIVMAIGVVVLVPAVRLLRLPMSAVALLAFSPAMVLNIRLGQLGTFVLLMMIGVHVAASRGQTVRAGAIAGLFILKPTLAVGYGLWWLLDAKRWYKSIAAAAVAGVVIAIPTVIGGFGPWRSFVDAMRFRVDAEGGWKQQSISLPEFLKLLFPQSPGAVTLLFWAIGLAAGAAMLVAARQRFDDDPEIMSAVAVVATVAASPHLLVYDAFILAIPVAVAWNRGSLSARRVQLLAALHVGSIVFGPGLYDAQYSLFQRGVSLEFPGLVVCSWLLVRWMQEAGGPATAPSDESVPVVANH